MSHGFRRHDDRQFGQSRRMPTAALLAALPGAWLASIGNPAAAVDLEWTNPNTVGPLFFNDPPNWTPAQTPTFADNLLFQIDQAGTLIILNAGSASNEIDFAANRWVFGGQASGDLTTDVGAVIDNPVGTGAVDAAIAEFTAGAVWNVGDENGATTTEGLLQVGLLGWGELRVNTGASVRPEVLVVGAGVDGTGIATVTGVGSTINIIREQNAGNTVVGDAGGTGTLNVLAGGQLVTADATDNDIHVGRGFFDDGTNPIVQSVGVLNVSDAGSFVETGDFYVGYLGGDGTVNITNGGQIVINDGSSPDFSLGRNAGSVGTAVIDGDGSLLSARHIDLGEQGGNATMTIRNGGRVETRSDTADTDSDMVRGDMFIATDTGSEATVAVYGSGTNPSTLRADILYVGNVGLGELRVGRDLNGTFRDGGQVEAGDLIVGDVDGNDADNRVIVDGANAQVVTSRAIVVGDAGRGIWESLNGSTTTVGTSFNVGVRDGSVSTALFDGAGTTLTAANLFIGNGTGVGSTGTATFRNGATATLTGAFGISDAGSAVTVGDDDEGIGILNIQDVGSRVEATNSTWFIGGSENENGGTGTVNISAGGVGIASSRTWIGYRNGANGTLNVTGPGSRYDGNGDFIIAGHEGRGFVNVENGGVVNARGFIAGNESGSTGSTVIVDGAGSELNLTQRLYVGDEFEADMFVSGGAVVDVATNPGSEVADQRLVIGRINSGNDSSLTVTGAGSTVNYFGGERISVGFNAGTAANRNELRVLDGGVVRAFRTDAANPTTQGFLVLGDEVGGHGQLVVDGAGSLVDVRYLDIGQANSTSGSVRVSNGGVVQIADFSEVGAAGDGDNFLTVEGVGSRYETGGDLSVAAGSSSLRVDGEMRVRDGGAVVTGRNGYIGRASTNVGRVDLGGTGALATWDVASTFYMSGNNNVATASGSQSSGSSQLNLLENGRISVGGNFYLKDRGTINLTGGELITGDLIFLDFGGSSYTPVPTVNWDTGLIRYTNNTGKTLNTFNLDILFNNGAYLLDAGKHLAVDGTAVLGAPLEVNGGTLSVGNIAAANFRDNVEFNAGTLNFGGDVVITPTGLFRSALIIDGDEAVNVANQLNVTAGSLISVTRGSYSAGTSVNFGTIVVTEAIATYNGTLDNRGDLVVVDGTVLGSVNNNGGDLTVVNSATVGDVELFSTGTLSLGVNNTAGGDSDVLNVLGAAFVNGTLNVSVGDTNDLQVGDEFDLILADSISGTFANELLPTLGNGLAFDVLYEANRVALAVIGGGGLAGDYNGNGAVEQADLDLVLTNWGGDRTFEDGVTAFATANVDQEELDRVLTNWGSIAAPSFEGSAIPEPAAAVAVFGLSLLASRRRIA